MMLHFKVFFMNFLEGGVSRLREDLLERIWVTIDSHK